MDGGAWWTAVHGVMKSWTWLSDFTFIFHFLTLEKEMATHSSVLAWRIPGTGEPGGAAVYGVAQSRTLLQWLSSSSSSSIVQTVLSHQSFRMAGNLHCLVSSSWSLHCIIFDCFKVPSLFSHTPKISIPRLCLQILFFLYSLPYWAHLFAQLALFPPCWWLLNKMV